MKFATSKILEAQKVNQQYGIDHNLDLLALKFISQTAASLLAVRFVSISRHPR